MKRKMTNCASERRVGAGMGRREETKIKVKVYERIIHWRWTAMCGLRAVMVVLA
jgi:hypothetical protein